MMQKKHLSVIIICLVLGAFFAIVQVGISGGMISGYRTTNLFLMGINIILAASLNLINGFTGEFSLGHAGFMAVGAYAGGVITTNLGLPFPLAIVVGMLAAAVAGVIVGLPTLRLRGDYLAIATLGFGEIVRVVLMNIDYVGGASGLKGIPDVVNWPIIFFSVVLSLLLIKNFIGSSHGRACLAVRENDLAAQMMGVNITYYKVLALAVYRHVTGRDAADFDIHVNIVGGGRVEGPSAGAAIFLAIYSAIEGIPLRQDVAVTGELSIQGHVRGVGGVTEKIYGARQVGIKKVLVPRENSRELPGELWGVQVVSIDKINEAFSHTLNLENAAGNTRVNIRSMPENIPEEKIGAPENTP
jgi:ABC-type branched-subunit amino acid transport system permease subunit